MDISSFQPPLAATNWRVYRIVPSLFPPVSIFDRLAEPGDLDALHLIDNMTNERIRDDIGEIRLVPAEDRIVGPGTTAIMAAFTHLNPEGGRFNDNTFGAYYAALEIATAIAETKYHREVWLSRTNEAPIDVDMRVYLATLSGDLHDVRGGSPASIYDPVLYGDSQSLATRLRGEGSNGLIYDSVRHAGGTCVAAFRPRLLTKCRQERHLTYRWDGEKIREVYEKRSFTA